MGQRLDKHAIIGYKVHFDSDQLVVIRELIGATIFPPTYSPFLDPNKECDAEVET